jgi:hypothetical protein
MLSLPLAIGRKMTNRFFAERGLLDLPGWYKALRKAPTAVYGPVCTVVWDGEVCEAFPYPDSIMTLPECALIVKR